MDIFSDSIASPFIGVFFFVFAFAFIIKIIFPNNSNANNIVSILSVSTGFYGASILISYLIGNPYFYHSEIHPVALNGGICVILLSLGLFFIAGTETVIIRSFIGNSPLAKVLRKIVPLTFFAVITGSFSGYFFQNNKKFNYSIIVSLEIVLISIISIFVVVKFIKNIFTDSKKNYDANIITNAAIAELNKNLEKQILEKTTRLISSNKELQTFSHSVSHDLRSPLRSIDGWSTALYEDYHDKLDAKGVMYINTIRKETQRMGALIDDLIKLSRLSQADVKIELVDISKIALAIVEHLKSIDSGRKLEFIIEPGLTVTGDNGLLEIALNNLFDNSFKFTAKKEKGIIEFGLDKMKTGKVFYIRDNRAGFNMAYAGKLFGAFQRMHSQNEFPGTGIGLATVLRVFNRLEGNIWAESEVGKGTTFFFSMKKE